MADSGHQNVLARAVIKSAYIYNTVSGKQVSVVGNLMNIDIYEDIYSPFVYCDLILIDYNSVAKQFPLMGEEYFVLSFNSIGGKQINYHFLLYKNDTGGMTPTNSAKGYILRGVTLERAFDTGKTVSSAYTGTYSRIAGQIFDDYIKKDTGGLDFNYEPSKSVQRYVVPQVSPLSAIEYCRSRAVSTSAAKSPFVFFRNSEGYTFMSMNGLFNKNAAAPSAQITHRYAPRSLPAEFNESGDAGSKVDIVSFDIVAYYDTMSKIDKGAFNTHTYTFDLTTKAFVLRKQYNLSDNADTFQLGGGSQYNRSSFTSLFSNTRCAAMYVPTNTSLEVNGDQSTQKDFFPDHMGEMMAYINLVSEYNIHYTMYGDSNVTAGQVMKISVPQAQEESPGTTSKYKQDAMYSGNFLCARVVHMLTFNENVDYYVRVSAINGARSKSVEDIQNG